MKLQRIHVGYALAGVLVVTAGIALNRGIDLLWGMVALLTAALGCGLLLPRLQVRRLALRRDFPREAVVGQPVALGYEIVAGGLLPRFGVEVLDGFGSAGSLVAAAYFAKLSGRRPYRLQWTPRTRGRRTFGDVVLESRFPFGIACARRRVEAGPATMTVYPAFEPLDGLPVPGGSDPNVEHVVTSRRGGRDETFGLKPYRPGDDARSVSWRATARTGELVVREYEHPQDRQLWIVLDLSAHDHAGEGETGTLECMLRVAHSVAVKALEQGVPVGLLHRVGEEIRTLGPAADRASYLRLREALALVDADDREPLDGWLARASAQLPRSGTWLLFNLGDAGRRGRLAQIARQRHAAPLFVEFDRATFAEPTAAPASGLRTVYGRDLVCTVARGAPLRALFATR